MIPQIASAISKGFSASQVIKFILKKFPNHKDAIEKAMAAGFTADQVIRYLSRGGKEEGENLEEPQIDTDYSRMRKRDISRNEAQEKAVLGGLGALGAAPFALNALAGMNTPNVAMAMQHAMPNQIKSMTPALTGPHQPQTLQQLPSQPPVSPLGQAPITPPPVGQAATVPQPPIPTQAIKPQRDIKKSLDIIKNLGEEVRIKNLLDGGLSPKDIAGVLSKLMPKDKLKALEGLEGGVEGAIEDYVQATQEQPQELSAMEPLGQELGENKQEIKEGVIESAKPITKNSIVSSPSGIGEVKEIRNGKALVEVDGKLHKVNESDLEPPKFSEDEIADAYDDLISKIPEEHRSGFISWAGYDDERNVIGFIPRGGKYEELHNITPEEAEKIKEGKGVARTTGETREGLWVMGEDTRGGVISQIIHDRREKHKGEEEKQLKLGFELPKREKEDKGMKPIFDEMAHARSLSRERERKKILAERERKKKERDEAKKRKK
jgi:hypothetical protein